MQQIIKEGNNIGEWETKEITNLNIIYVEAEKLLEIGYKMYYTNQLVEAFVLLMQFTKFFDLVYKNKHLIIDNDRHKKLNDAFKNVVPIMENLKSILLEKYEKKNKPIINSNRKISFIDENTESKEDMWDNLEKRWQHLVKKNL